jgi:hypothetical protein
MPVQLNKDKEGCFARWGIAGKKYYYPCNDEIKRNKAKQLAYLQGLAIGDTK